MGMEAAVESRFDESEGEKTVRMVVAAARALSAEEGEIAKLRADNANLLRLNIQLRQVNGLLRTELARTKASHEGTEKRVSIAETMAEELMRVMEGLSQTGLRLL